MFKPEAFHPVLFSVITTETFISKQASYPLINNQYFSLSVVNAGLEESFDSRLFRF
jgi:hypothetical protein